MMAICDLFCTLALHSYNAETAQILSPDKQTEEPTFLRISKAWDQFLSSLTTALNKHVAAYTEPSRENADHLPLPELTKARIARCRPHSWTRDFTMTSLQRMGFFVEALIAMYATQIRFQLWLDSKEPSTALGCLRTLAQWISIVSSRFPAALPIWIAPMLSSLHEVDEYFRTQRNDIIDYFSELASKLESEPLSSKPVIMAPTTTWSHLLLRVTIEILEVIHLRHHAHSIKAISSFEQLKQFITLDRATPQVFSRSTASGKLAMTNLLDSTDVATSWPASYPEYKRLLRRQLILDLLMDSSILNISLSNIAEIPIFVGGLPGSPPIFYEGPDISWVPSLPSTEIALVQAMFMKKPFVLWALWSDGLQSENQDAMFIQRASQVTDNLEKWIAIVKSETTKNTLSKGLKASSAAAATALIVSKLGTHFGIATDSAAAEFSKILFSTYAAFLVLKESDKS